MIRTLAFSLLLAIPCGAQTLSGGSFTNVSGLSSSGGGAQLFGVVSGGTLGVSGSASSQLQAGPVPGSGASVVAQVGGGPAFGSPGAPTGGGIGGGSGGCDLGGKSAGVPMGLAWLALLLGAGWRRRRA